MIRSDNPITTSSEDVLGRDRVAQVISAEIRSLDVSHGSVVGILGPWGSGKTSLTNLIRADLAGPPSVAVLEFNPWLFSGANQLVESFFVEIAAQLRLKPGRLQAIAEAMEAYGEVVAPLRFLPMLGPWIERARGMAKGLKNLYERRRKGVAEARGELSKRLRELDAPIVVVVDDIDRLRTDEIRDIFKLVRLTANFPNVVYLLAFDRTRVESALSEDGLPGRDYLEKIVQVSYDIPAIPDAVLRSQITKGIDEALDGVEDTGPFDAQRWPDVLMELIRPLIRNMRDVRRYAAALRGTVVGLEGKVELVDVLGLEAIRVFLPDVFARLPASVEALTTPSSSWSYGANTRDAQLKATIAGLVEAASENAGLVRDMINRLFPAALRHTDGTHYDGQWLRTWMRERRVAHSQILKFYLERVAGDELQATWTAERAFDLLADAPQLDAFLRSLDPETLRDVISALETYEEEYPEEAVTPATVTLLNLLPELPVRPQGMFDFGNEMVVTRVVLRLLRRLSTSDAVEEAVRSALPQVTRLRWRLTLLTIVGHEENAGHKLVSEDAAQQLERDLRDQVRGASADELASENGAVELLTWTSRTSGQGEASLEPPNDRGVIATVLKGAVTEAQSQPMGSLAVTREKRLYWDGLVQIFRDEDALGSAIDLVAEDADEDPELAEAIELGLKYLGGWRPRHFPAVGTDDTDDEPPPDDAAIGG